MGQGSSNKPIGGHARQRVFIYDGGFLHQQRLRRILHLSGYDVKLGRPKAEHDMLAVWGQSPTAPRDLAAAKRNNTPTLRVEDAFLCSIHPGRASEPPLGLLMDKSGVHFDPATPSDLEQLLARHPLDDTALLDRARMAIQRLKQVHLSKYSAFVPSAPVPEPGYVLVVDQTRNDASVIASGAGRAEFLEMLVFAQEENPGARIIIKTYPETVAGHFTPNDASEHVTLFADPVSPWALLEGATAVYSISSQLGFEAILAGHKPRVFGQPFYAGWGLSADENPPARRSRSLTRAQLFAAAMILYPKWYDPYRDRSCELEGVIDALEAQARAWREDHMGYVALGMRLWKRAPLQSFYGQTKKLRFAANAAKAGSLARESGRRLLVWANKGLSPEAAVPDRPPLRLEDGFLRSRGLGAALTPPLSLVTDDLGIYYDPARESRLERLIATAPDLPDHALHRAERLIASITKAGLSKYNLAARPLPDLPQGRRILVVGQVEDDASVLKGCVDVRSNLALLKRARADNADAVILYKPHPDVEAGLRLGAVAADQAGKYADLTLPDSDPIALIGAVDEVWTLTSLLGFEALLRGRSVTCLGAPFYAGWGLTRDLGDIPKRRRARPTLAGLAHASLIAYPRYFDPVSKLPCPPEVIIGRLHRGGLPGPRAGNRALSKLQGVFASYAHLWRR